MSWHCCITKVDDRLKVHKGEMTIKHYKIKWGKNERCKYNNN